MWEKSGGWVGRGPDVVGSCWGPPRLVEDEELGQRTCYPSYPPRAREGGERGRIGIGGLGWTRRGEHWGGRRDVGTHDMVVALCDRMVVAILGDSRRHKGHSAVVDSPGGPRVGQKCG